MPTTASVKPGRDVTLTTEDVLVTTTVTPLSIRSGPSTNYYIKAKAPKGSTLVRIEKADEMSSDNRYWDRVAYDTGSEIIIGYASREYLEDTATIATVNEEATISVMCNLRNGPASTVNTKVKQILEPGTKVTIIDKMDEEYGHTWYRVKLEDGTQGYVSSAFIGKESDTENDVENNPDNKPDIEDNPEANPDKNPDIEDKTENNPDNELDIEVEGKYRIEGSNIIVAPSTVITDISGAVLTGDVFGTGAKITIGEKEYTIVMLGDVSGDGAVKSKDYMMNRNYIMETLTLSEIEMKAADLSGDGAIKSKDYMMIRNHIMEISQITI